MANDELSKAVAFESQQFEVFYVWLKRHMPPAFFEEFEPTQLMTIAHNLMGFNLQGNFIQINFKTCSIVLCIDSPDADLRILKNFAYYGIKSYQTFISDEPPPLEGCTGKLRIAILFFTQLSEEEATSNGLEGEVQREVFAKLKEKHPTLTEEKLNHLVSTINPRFFRGMHRDRIAITLGMLFQATSRDHVQYEVKYNEHWNESEREIPSMQLVFAWKNTQKYNFLYRLAKLIHRHNLIMKRVTSSYIHPYSSDSLLIMSVAIHGQGDKAAWEATDIDDFLQEFAMLKTFEDSDQIESVFVTTKLIRGNLANFLRVIESLVHQLLLHSDANFYSLANIEEGLCRHPELVVQLCKCFELKFHPKQHNINAFHTAMSNFIDLVNKLDTGNLILDTRRKNILLTAIQIVHHTDKTNFYLTNKSAIAVRLNPKVLDALPYDRSEKFPELPYAIFFIRGKSFISFHIRFKDLSRGGLRTVFPQRQEQAVWERGNIFSECYNLAYTQQKKNKDIPEGGSKAVIFLEPYEEMRVETHIYQRELQSSGVSDKEMEEKLAGYQKAQKLVYLYQSQRSFIYNLLTLINCHDDGKLKASNIVDYYQKPEYIYLGPDENMHNEMIEWIAEYSKYCGYKLGKAFISSKPKYGINHKEFGVTSLGVNVYMHQVLLYLNINPEKDRFTVKMSGGPDGDVGGNQIYNLYRFYPKTAKLLAITDVSGTMYDPEGIDLPSLVSLFKEEKPIRFYPTEKLHEGGFLLDLQSRRAETSYSQQTLCYKKEKGKLTEQWLGGNETHHLYSHNLHEVIADIFIPAGGRPRTLNSSNWKNFLTPSGTPTSKAIVEGANLYLTPEARSALEEKGTLIIKDSSANKGGVICSSLEVLSGLLLSEEEFLTNKPILMPQILQFIEEKARNEANLLLSTHSESGKPLTEISDHISKKINTFTYQILDHLEKITLSKSLSDPLIKCLIDYCPKLFREKYKDRLLTHLPPIHQKAIISCYIASRTVYERGLTWDPSIVDILPLLVH